MFGFEILLATALFPVAIALLPAVKAFFAHIPEVL